MLESEPGGGPVLALSLGTYRDLMRSEKYCLYKIYLFARLITEREKRQRRMGWRERDSNWYFSFKWPQATTNTEMNHTKARSQELHLDLQHGCTDPRTYVITCCFPRHFSMGWFRSRAAWTRTGTQKMPEPKQQLDLFLNWVPNNILVCAVLQGTFKIFPTWGKKKKL